MVYARYMHGTCIIHACTSMAMMQSRTMHGTCTCMVHAWYLHGHDAVEVRLGFIQGSQRRVALAAAEEGLHVLAWSGGGVGARGRLRGRSELQGAG